MPISSAPVLIALTAGLAVAAIIDIRTRRIPNWLTTAMGCAGLALAVTGWSGVSPAAALAGAALGLTLMLPGHVFGATGAGDVKLMAAVGAIVGPTWMVQAFLFTAVVGGLLAVIVASGRRRLPGTLARTCRLIAITGMERPRRGAADAGSRFAYGPAVALGTLLAGYAG